MRLLDYRSHDGDAWGRKCRYGVPLEPANAIAQISLMTWLDHAHSAGVKMVSLESRTHTASKTLLLPSGTRKSRTN